MENQILELLGRSDYAPANIPELLNLLGWSRNRQQELQHELRELETSGRIARIKGNRYILPQEADLISGRIPLRNCAGQGLQPDETIKEIAIPENALLTALHEDQTVLAPQQWPASKNNGTVILALKRHRTKIVLWHLAEELRRFLFVVPGRSCCVCHMISMFPEPRDASAARRTSATRWWSCANGNRATLIPEGEIIEAVGAPDEAAGHAVVLRQYNLPLHFPGNVLAEARRLAAQ